MDDEAPPFAGATPFGLAMTKYILFQSSIYNKLTPKSFYAIF